MRSLLVVFILIAVTPGCSLMPGSSPLISNNRLVTRQTPLVYAELPESVRKKIESENFDSPIIRIWEVEEPYKTYYELDFQDGNTERFRADGTVHLGGLI